jgi:hypothetical protein
MKEMCAKRMNITQINDRADTRSKKRSKVFSVESTGSLPEPRTYPREA